MPEKNTHFIRLISLFILGIICCCSAIVCQAQNAVINAVEPNPSDMTASYAATSRKDLAGKPCALVKVSVMAEDVTFAGNVVKDVPRKGAEYWVYMTEGTKQLQISSSKFKTLKINFPDYGIDALKGEQVYCIDISLPTNANEGAAFELTVTPANARVFIDGKLMEVSDNGLVGTYLTAGSHKYHIEAEGYKDADGTIKMENKLLKKAVKLYSLEKLRVHHFRALNGKIGFKDQNDNIVTKAEFDKVIPAGSVFWVTKKGKYGMVNEQGVVVAQPNYDSVSATPTDGIFIVGQNGKYGVVNPNGWLTVPCMLDKISATSSSMLVGVMDGQFGLIDASGELIIPCENEEITDFFDGMAGIRKDGKCGFINTNGEIVIPCKYDGVSHFSGGMARVVEDGNAFFIDKQGNKVNF